MWRSEAEQLDAVLEDFRSRFNTNQRAQKLVNNWNRFLVLDAQDTGRKFALVVKDLRIDAVVKVTEIDEEADGLIHLQADEAVLQAIFSGRYNPATALVDGALAVFSQDRDKVKLEALAMVIWRLG
jgi:SCP-2 sterol transfer family